MTRDVPKESYEGYNGYEGCEGCKGCDGCKEYKNGLRGCAYSKMSSTVESNVLGQENDFDRQAEHVQQIQEVQ